MSNALKAIVLTAAVVGFACTAFAVYTVATTQRYRVPSQSMEPGTGVGTQVALKTRAYAGDKRPAIGDLVIAHPPAGAETNECGVVPPAGEMCSVPKGGPSDVKFIKRVVAAPGDRVRMEDGKVIRNGEPMDEPYVAACEPGAACDFPTEIVVPADHYLLLGDNRGGSDDGRFWGPVQADWILGRVEDCALVYTACSPRR